ncbi:hypothetical protein JCM8547_007033 [Rhodosporidiobolus lusitaniae]
MLDRLPPELLLSILDWLVPPGSFDLDEQQHTLATWCRVSKRLRAFAHPRLWRVFRPAGQQVKLAVEFPQLAKHVQMPKGQNQAFQNVEHLILYHVDTARFPCLIFPNLVSLTLVELKSSEFAHASILTHARFPSLRALYISTEDPSAIYRRMPAPPGLTDQLDVLHISLGHYLLNWVKQALKYTCPVLVSIWNNEYRPTDTTIFSFFRHFDFAAWQPHPKGEQHLSQLLDALVEEPHIETLCLPLQLNPSSDLSTPYATSRDRLLSLCASRHIQILWKLDSTKPEDDERMNKEFGAYAKELKRKKAESEGAAGGTSALPADEEGAGASSISTDREGEATALKDKLGRPPVWLRLRSSTAFIALTVGFGVLVDLSSYAIIVPVIPFRLQELGFAEDRIGGLTAWLVAAYAGGLIVSSPVAAWVGAKYKNRQIPLIGGLLFMAGAIILFMETHNYAAMIVSRILQGFSGTMLWTIGLALVTDSVPEKRVGIVLGYVMLGFSLGQSIGPPVGGTMYARLGYRAPFIFSIILVAFDMLLRLCIVEKHIALKYIRAGLVEIKGFEAPGYEAEKEKENKGDGESDGTIVAPLADATEGDKTTEKKTAEAVMEKREGKGWMSRVPDEFLGFIILVQSPRALVSIALTFLNGYIVGGMLDTGMTIYLENEYGLDSLGAGLVFLGTVVPTFFASPAAGWITDKYGTKWIMVFGVLLSAISYPLLIIRGPLALFVFFLVLLGISISCFITPVTVDLSICAADTNGAMQTAHVFAMFNMSFSIGSFIGPIVGGQIINAVQIRTGWLALAIMATGLTALTLPLVVIWVGGKLTWGKKGVKEEADETGRAGGEET